MLFDRIIEDILGFIRRYLWFENNSDSNKKRPYQAVKTWYGDDAIVKLVIGRDTPRAVQTWIYSPKRVPGTRQSDYKDLHIYLDLDNSNPLLSENDEAHIQHFIQIRQKRLDGDVASTHRISILWASHFLNQHGFYNYNLVFFGDYDFTGAIAEGVVPTLNNPSIKPHPIFIQKYNRLLRRNATLVLENLVKACLLIPAPKMASMRSQDWQKIVDGVFFRTLKRRPSRITGIVNEPDAEI